jgi:hypothetical protein
MAHTVAQVKSPFLYDIVGTVKETVTDVTVATNSETVTAAELGLTRIDSAIPTIFTGQSTDTGVYAKATVAAGGASLTLAEFTADGTAATTAASTVVRVTARGT